MTQLTGTLRQLFRIRTVLLMVLDAALIALSLVAAFLLRFDGVIPGRYLYESLLAAVILMTVVTLPALFSFHLYSFVWARASSAEVIRLAKALGAGLVAFFALIFILGDVLPLSGFPRSVGITAFLLFFLLAALVRFSSVIARVIKTRFAPSALLKKEVVVGVDNATTVLQSPQVASAYSIVCVFDPSQIYHGDVLHGKPIYGGFERFVEVLSSQSIDTIIIASGDEPDVVDTVIKLAQDAEVLDVKIANPVQDVEHAMGVTLDNVGIEDMVGREPVSVDHSLLKDFFSGKVVLVTGGGGSIGSELARQLALYDPARIVLLDHSESRIYAIRSEFEDRSAHTPLTTYIADVTDRAVMSRIMKTVKPDVVLHAAAYKHVSLVEENAAVAARNNILGTINVIEAAGESRVPKLVVVSSDKAVYPTSVMGKTKRIGEMAARLYDGIYEHTDVLAVRFGNVVNSDGSVVPRFRAQIERGGPVTVTHPDMERYFMAIEEACLLVMEVAAFGRGGSLYVLDMGEPVRIAALAEKMITLAGKRPGIDIAITYTGMRPGERLREELIEDHEVLVETGQRNIFYVKTVSSTISGQQDAYAAGLDSLTRDCEDEAVHRILDSIIKIDRV
ncbi:MAG: nucleoside-diphosphate sugar epimerase/dehydratase [Candidatus Paceibacterota bacterium]